MPMGQAQLGFQSSPTTRPSLIGQPISASRPKLKQGGSPMVASALTSQIRPTANEGLVGVGSASLPVPQ
jgi:hypothetical protein